MPYITQDQRPTMDDIVRLMKMSDVKANRDLNYILYAFCKRHISPSYNNYKNFLGELKQCVVRIEQCLLGPYEDKMREINGDV